MNDNNYKRFCENLKEVPPVPENIYADIVKNSNKKVHLLQFIRISTSVAALFIGAFIFSQNKIENITENIIISTTINSEALLEESDYDNFDDYYPLANL